MELADIFKSYGGAAVLVSHNRGEVFRLADKIAVMNAGRIDALNTKREVFANPQTVAAAVLTGCKNISAVRKISATELFAEDWQINLSTAPLNL